MPGIQMTYYQNFTLSGKKTFADQFGVPCRVIGDIQLRECEDGIIGASIGPATTNIVPHSLENWGLDGNSTKIDLGEKFMGLDVYRFQSEVAASWKGPTCYYGEITTGSTVLSCWVRRSGDSGTFDAYAGAELTQVSVPNDGKFHRMYFYTASSANSTIEIRTAGGAGNWFDVCGLQVENSVTSPTPFLEKGTREAQHIEIPTAGVLPNWDGGGAIFFVRPDWAYTADSTIAGGYPRVWTLEDPTGARDISCAFSTAADQWYFHNNGGTGAVISSTHAMRDRIMLVYAWDRNTKSISVNGSAFNSQSWTPPEIGRRIWVGDDMSDEGNKNFHGSIEEFAFFRGVPTQTMVSRIYSDIFLRRKNLSEAGFRG